MRWACVHRWQTGVRVRRVALAECALIAWLGLVGRAVATDVAWVARINGAPTIVRAGASGPLDAGAAVSPGDRISTDEHSKVKLLLADDSVLAIGPQSQVTIDELALRPDGRTGRLHVLVGRFKLAIAEWLGGRSDYEVRMPTAVAGVRGTVLWGDTQLDAICALRGTVEVLTLTGARVATLERGHCETQMGSGHSKPLTPTREELDTYLREVTLE